MKITVMHTFYGCDTGCCGHVIEVDGEELAGSFDFSHPYGDPIQYAKDLITEKMGPEHVADLDWENCEISED